jgi:hypothetical protein
LPSRENTVMTGELVSSDQLRITVQYDGLQLDEIEYLLCKSLGYGVPISLADQFRPDGRASVTPAISGLGPPVRIAAVGGTMSPEVCEMLQEPGRDFALVRSDEWTSCPSNVFPTWAETGPCGSLPERWTTAAWRVIWHAQGDGHLLVPLPAERLV